MSNKLNEILGIIKPFTVLIEKKKKINNNFRIIFRIFKKPARVVIHERIAVFSVN